MRIELLLFLAFLTLVIVMIACSAPRRPTPVLSPTLFPTFTLSTYDPRLVARVSMEADIAATIIPAKPRLPEVDISPPRCYRTLSPQLTCLGFLTNRASSAISEISLAVKVIAGAGAPSEPTLFALEQWRIPARGKAPYRFHVPDTQAARDAVEIALVDAAIVAAANPRLVFEDEYADYLPASNTYLLRGILQNESDATAKDIRLIVALEDETGAIIGYRALDLSDALPAGDSRAIEVEITPLEPAAETRHRVTAQAARAE